MHKHGVVCLSVLPLFWHYRLRGAPRVIPKAVCLRVMASKKPPMSSCQCFPIQIEARRYPAKTNIQFGILAATHRVQLACVCVEGETDTGKLTIPHGTTTHHCWLHTRLPFAQGLHPSEFSFMCCVCTHDVLYVRY